MDVSRVCFRHVWIQVLWEYLGRLSLSGDKVVPKQL